MAKSHTYHCFFCERAFTYQPHVLDAPQVYPVRLIEDYGVSICRRCATEMMDGIPRDYEHRLTTRLRAEGRSVPSRNDDGLLPMPFKWTSAFKQDAYAEE